MPPDEFIMACESLLLLARIRDVDDGLRGCLVCVALLYFSGVGFVLAASLKDAWFFVRVAPTTSENECCSIGRAVRHPPPASARVSIMWQCCLRILKTFPDRMRSSCTNRVRVLYGGSIMRSPIIPYENVVPAERRWGIHASISCVLSVFCAALRALMHSIVFSCWGSCRLEQRHSNESMSTSVIVAVVVAVAVAVVVVFTLTL